MTSEILPIKTVEDFSRAKGWMVEDFRYDPEGMQMILDVSSLLAPNKVRIMLKQNVAFAFPAPGCISYQTILGVSSKDIVSDE
jgi:hypothetical protein